MVILSKIVATGLLLGVIFFLYFFAMSDGYKEYQSMEEMLKAGILKAVFITLSVLPISGIVLLWDKKQRKQFFIKAKRS